MTLTTAPSLFQKRKLYEHHHHPLFYKLSKLFKLFGWPAGWPAGWLTGWLAGWLAGWPAGWPAGWLAGWLASWLANWLASWLAGWLAGWLALANFSRFWTTMPCFSKKRKAFQKEALYDDDHHPFPFPTEEDGHDHHPFPLPE